MGFHLNYSRDVFNVKIVFYNIMFVIKITLLYLLILFVCYFYIYCKVLEKKIVDYFLI
jgi:hypothetical protein